MSKKEVYVLRHSIKGPDGNLSQEGILAAQELAKRFPKVHKVVSSPNKRVEDTAKLITGQEPIVDERAHYVSAKPELSDRLNAYAEKEGKTFLQAVFTIDDPDLQAELEEYKLNIEKKATHFHQLIEQLFSELPEGEIAIIFASDLSISPAMQKWGRPIESIDFLHGYIIDEEGNISEFTP